MDKLLQQIQQSLDEQYQKGYEDGWNAVWNAMEAFVRTGGSEQHSAEQPSIAEPSEPADVGEMPAADSAQPASAERVLTPAQQRALDYVTEHRGMTAHEIRGIGKSTLYRLINAGVLAKIDGRFYPAELA